MSGDRKTTSFEITAMPDGGYVVSVGSEDPQRGVYRHQLFASASVAEALEYIRSRIHDGRNKD